MIDKDYLSIIEQQCQNHPNATPWVIYIKVLLSAYKIQLVLMKQQTSELLRLKEQVSNLGDIIKLRDLNNTLLKALANEHANVLSLEARLREKTNRLVDVRTLYELEQLKSFSDTTLLRSQRDSARRWAKRVSLELFEYLCMNGHRYKSLKEMFDLWLGWK